MSANHRSWVDTGLGSSLELMVNIPKRKAGPRVSSKNKVVGSPILCSKLWYLVVLTWSQWVARPLEPPVCHEFDCRQSWKRWSFSVFLNLPLGSPTVCLLLHTSGKHRHWSLLQTELSDVFFFHSSVYSGDTLPEHWLVVEHYFNRVKMGCTCFTLLV